MEFTAVWSKMPRWARGLVLGNLCYVVFMLTGLSLTNLAYYSFSMMNIVFLPFMSIAMEFPYPLIALGYYGVWCACSVWLAKWLGEWPGIVILIVFMPIVNFAIFFFALATGLFGISF